MRTTAQEKRAWVRLSWELTVLRDLAIGILCDREYQDIMSKAALGGLSRAVNGIDRVRNEADVRSSRQVVMIGPDLFYGSWREPAHDFVSELREKLAAEAVAMGDRVYNLAEEEPLEYTIPPPYGPASGRGRQHRQATSEHEKG